MVELRITERFPICWSLNPQPSTEQSRFAADGQPLRLAGSPLPLSRRRAATQGETLPVAVDVFLSCKLCGCVQGRNVAMSSSAARSADR